MKITLDDHVMGWQNIKVYGRRVGYYTHKRTISWLIQNQCKLTQAEKEEVVKHIGLTLGLPIRGAPWRQFIDERRDETADAG